jgi:hypothetical protein
MKPCLCLAAVLLAGGSRARADEPWLLFDGRQWALPKLSDEWRQRHCWCPDNYGCKPVPTVPPNARGCVDDYCPKSLPRVPCNPRGCVDDYCPKDCPLFLGPLSPSWYRCGPPEHGGAASCGCSAAKP